MLSAYPCTDSLNRVRWIAVPLRCLALWPAD